MVLHGGGPKGVESAFIARLFDSLTELGESVFAFNLPYCERGEEQANGEDLAEETAALDDVVKALRAEGYEKLVLVAKSLGGIVASLWLEHHSTASGEKPEVKIAVLGYVVGSVRTEALRGHLTAVIQGEHDRFGDGTAVEWELKKHGTAGTVVEVPGADHSYHRAPGDGAHQEQAIALLVDSLR